MKLRDYQEKIRSEGSQILEKYGFLYLSMEVRTGKTFTSLAIANTVGAKKVLFLTKKKAISSIQDDYNTMNPDFEIIVINYESIHKVKENDFDLLILDEAHQLGTFPKPNNKVKAIKKRFGDRNMILLSGTASPESYSQYFHQFFIRSEGVWSRYKNFYRWCDDFVNITETYTSYGKVNDYSDANYELIMEDIHHLIITFTQEQAGFISQVDEEVLHVKMEDRTYNLIKRLQNDKVIDAGDQTVLADTKVKEMQKIHQMYSGTIKFENGDTKCFDYSKGNFIRNHFEGKKLGIFYNFKAEKELLKDVFGDNITDDLDEFNTSDKHIMLQIVSGREGISLKKADYIVFYNIAFSAVSYFQAKDRMTTQDRKNNTVYWIFSEGGLEDQIYETVQEKKNFTSKIYQRGMY